jgi:Protein of unknown function (DUF2782)
VIEMKILSLLLLVSIAFPTISAAEEKPRRPANAEVIDTLVLPAEKDLPKGKTLKDFDRDTTIIKRKDGEDTITEYRLKGQLYKMVVKPAKGLSYTLVDEKGNGKFIPAGEQTPKIAVPMWVLLTW